MAKKTLRQVLQEAKESPWQVLWTTTKMPCTPLLAMIPNAPNQAIRMQHTSTKTSATILTLPIRVTHMPTSTAAVIPIAQVRVIHTLTATLMRYPTTMVLVALCTRRGGLFTRIDFCLSFAICHFDEVFQRRVAMTQQRFP